ncbi:MAG: tetraacyldisaccharide 4'-kinase [Methylococcales bacterium]|nr:tetraacyldisaccharide 4'-kinase [Methylococcales bacterium]
MKKTISRYLFDLWYNDHYTGAALMPFGFLFSDFVKFRRWLYKIGYYKNEALPVPVIIVGNITVGGTGKTPLCIYLANLLQSEGYRVGIISRGYGGEASVQMVLPNSKVAEVGDEALLIAKQTNCPMAVGANRVEAGKFLLKHAPCDVIVADDGLQHYALKRDIEIAVIDGKLRFGNSICLPAGPLREPIERLNTVDFVIVNGERTTDTLWHEWEMQLIGDTAINLLTGENKTLAEFKNIDCHAIAGIGNPERFFKQLEKAGISQRLDYSFPDHHVFIAKEITFKNQPVFMTEKDAVKCKPFATENHLFVPVVAQLSTEFNTQFLTLLKTKPFKRAL